MTDPMHIPKRVIPVTAWSRYHDWPTIAGLRHLIFHSKYNGFDRVIRRAGRRVLIDEESFFQWLEKKSTQGGSHE